MSQRLVFLSTMEHARWGGSEELWSLTAKRLSEDGHEVHASVQWWDEPVSQVAQLAQAGCQVHYRRFPGALERMVRRKRPERRFHWLTELRPDLLVISQVGYFDGLTWAAACIEHGIPYVTLAQNAPEFYWPNDEEGARVQAMHRHARANYFVAQGNIDLAVRQLGCDVPHAQVVRNPFNVAYNAAPAWPPSEDGFRLACVAQLLPVHKGQDLLFDVLLSPRWRERPVHLTLVGSGPNEANLRALQARYNLHNVTFGGFTQDITQVWATHHAMVLPSRCEGTPLAVVEAMLCGRPCIVTDVAGNAEVVADNITGFVAAAPTVHALDEAMERAWTRRASWEAMGQAGARRIRELVPPDPVGFFADELLQVATRSAEGEKSR